MAARTTKKQDAAQPSFEQAITRLKEIIVQMDDSGTELEQMIALSKEGYALIKRSRSILANAELQIQTLENTTEEADDSTLLSESDDEFTLQ